MNKLKKQAMAIIKDESAQGTTEYIILLVALVGGLMIFKTEILNIVNDQIAGLKAKVSGAMQ